MTSLVLAQQEARFPAGTTVNAYLDSAFPVGWRAADGLPASAVSQGSAAVQTDGSLTIAGLTAATKYKLYASVGGVPTFESHYVQPPTENISVGLLEANQARIGSPPTPAYIVEIYESDAGLLLDKSIVRLRGVASVDASRGAGFWGLTGYRVELTDQAGVDATTVPYLYGARIRMSPRRARNQSGIDDVVGVIVINKSFTDYGATYNGTEAIYIGYGGGDAVTKDWNAGVGIDTIADNAMYIVRGPYSYGILMTATFSTAAMRIPNNTPIVGRNAANGANIDLLRLSSTDYIKLGSQLYVHASSERVGIGAAAAAPSYPLDINSAGVTDGNLTGSIVLRALDTTAFAANVGGAIILGGYIDATPNKRTFAAVKGGKANATSGNTAGYLGLWSRSAAGGLIEVIRITELQAIQITEASDFVLGTATGSKIGTATAQKLAFHGSTPVIQRAGAAQAAVVTTAAALASYGFTQAQADSIVTLLNELRAAMVEKGLIKGSA